MKLLERIQSTARHDESRPAYINVTSGQTLTYGELASLIQMRRRADRVVQHGGNRCDFATMLLQLIASGAEVLCLPRSATEQECQMHAARIGGSAIYSEEKWETSIAASDSSPAGAANARKEGALLLATSGCTGKARIVQRVASSLDAMARVIAESIALRPDDRVLMMLPLAHSYAMEHGVLGPLWAGATVLLCGGLNLRELSDAMRIGATVFPAVPAIIELLSDNDAPRIGGLRTIYSAGGFLPPAVRDRFVRRHKISVGQVYGATEIGSVTYTFGTAEDAQDVGKPLAGVSIRILNLEDPGQIAARGVTGEIAVRSPFMLAGYADLPGENPRLIDGHFCTGDLGFMREGRLHITGRIKFLIDTGNEKVNPIEVEEVIASYPGVRECVVVHLRQTDTVSRLKAIVVPRNVSEFDVAGLRQFARENLAAHKVPRVIELGRELPRSATGKVLRHSVSSA